MSDDKGNGAGRRDGEAKMMMATSTPLLSVAVHGMEATGMVKMGRTQ